MPWNQSMINHLVEKGYGPNDPEWKRVYRDLAQHTPEPDWDQMRADLGIRRDPIMEILDEPNLPLPNYGVEVPPSLTVDNLVITTRSFSFSGTFSGGMTDLSDLVKQMIDSMGTHDAAITPDQARQVVDSMQNDAWTWSGAPPPADTFTVTFDEPTAADEQRERMKAHIAEERRAQRSKRFRRKRT